MKAQALLSGEADEAIASSSDAWFERAQRRLPGGVNSPVRAFRAVGGHPIFVESASGARLRSVSSTEYIDFVGSWGASILGHAHPAVVEEVTATARRGLSFGTTTALEVEFAEVIAARYPSMPMLRCVSSGTEATMSALRLARGVTGRDCIVKFEGAYHGHSDTLLVKAGSGAATFGAPDSAGVPEAIARHTLLSRYNDAAQLRALFSERGRDIAAVIVEPVAGNMGCVPPRPGFLAAIIDVCREYGALSIFDEVMTGCRVAAGGAQELYGLEPDLTCLGKVVGGGLPLAVYGGRRDAMEWVSPLGPVYQAGTLSGNPLAVSAGLATLALLTPSSYRQLEVTSAHLAAGLEDAARAASVPVVVQRVGSMLTVFFNSAAVANFDDAQACDKARFAKFHQALVARGVYWPPAQLEAAFVSLAHGPDEIDRTLSAAREAFQVAAS